MLTFSTTDYLGHLSCRTGPQGEKVVQMTMDTIGGSKLIDLLSASSMQTCAKAISCCLCIYRYGEKTVKGSPYPRSYYKCSHAGCNVKKIVERDPKTGEVSSAIAKVASSAISCMPAHNHLLKCAGISMQAMIGFCQCRVAIITRNLTAGPPLDP